MGEMKALQAGRRVNHSLMISTAGQQVERLFRWAIEMVEEWRMELVGTPGAYRLWLRVTRSESRTGVEEC